MTSHTQNHPTIRRLAIALASLAFSTLAFAGITGASASSATTEHFTFMADSTTQAHPTFSAIANGAFTAGGTATPNRGSVVLQFPAGTITLKVHTDHTTTRTTPNCLQEQTKTGRYTIASGSGAYRSVRGSGTTRMSARFVETKTHGACSSNFDAAQVIVTATGSITLR